MLSSSFLSQTIRLLASAATLVGLMASCKQQPPQVEPPSLPKVVDFRVHDYPHALPDPLTQAPGPNAVRVIVDPLELKAIREKYARNHAFERHYAYERGDQAALEETKWKLRSGNPHFVHSALEELAGWLHPTQVKFDKETRDLVMSYLLREETRPDAIDAFPEVAPDEVQTVFSQLLRSGELTEGQTQRVIFRLGQHCRERDCIDLIASAYDPAADDMDDIQLVSQSFGALIDIYGNGNDSLRQYIESILLPLVETHQANTREEESLTRIFAEYPAPRHLDFFAQRLDSLYFKDDAIKGYAQLLGKEARPGLRKLFSSYLSHAFRSIPVAWKDDLPGGLAALKEAYAKFNKAARSIRPFVYVAWELGGPEMAQQFLASLPNSEEKRDMEKMFPLYYLPMQPDHPFRLKADSLFQLGYYDAPVPDSVVEGWIEKGRESADLFFYLDPWEINSCVKFLTLRSAQQPAPYDALILNEYVPLAGGKLDQLEVYMAWEKGQEGLSHEQVWVVLGDKGYTFRPNQLQGRFDHASVRRCLNRVVSDAGLSKRFICFGDNGYTTGHIFIQPENALSALRVSGILRGEEAVHPTFLQE